MHNGRQDDIHSEGADQEAKSREIAGRISSTEGKGRDDAGQVTERYRCD